MMTMQERSSGQEAPSPAQGLTQLWSPIQAITILGDLGQALLPVWVIGVVVSPEVTCIIA